MLKTDNFGQQLSQLGFSLYSGVPCSFLKDLINYAINHEHYINASNEGDAVAVCAGAALAGKKTVMLMQNSGLGNTVSPITSLLYTFQIPILIVVSLRGEPGINDEPQHELMGQITQELLTTMKVPSTILDSNPDIAKTQLIKANQDIDSGNAHCIIVKKNTFEPHALKQSQEPAQLPKKPYIPINPTAIATRTEALSTIKKAQPPSCVLLATTGKTGRELFELGDQDNQLYQVGSMGCISALGLGIALSQPTLPTIVIDGDGAALMRLGSWATNGYYGPKNMCHILLDNETHDSTGGQDTLSKGVQFAHCAQAMNYPQTHSVTSLESLSTLLHTWQKNPELTFIHVKIHPGSPKKLGRPTQTPATVATRLKTYIKQTIS